MSVSTTSSLSLIDFTAYELPAKKWMKLIRPTMRLRVRLPYQNRDFVSSSVKVGDRSTATGCTGVPDFKSVGWSWNDDERFPQPCFADDDVFEVVVERRFLLWYKSIRRTKPATIDQVRTGDHCALSLYDGQQFTDVADEGRVEIGEITFALRSDVISEGGASSTEGKVSFMTYA